MELRSSPIGNAGFRTGIRAHPGLQFIRALALVVALGMAGCRPELETPAAREPQAAHPGSPGARLRVPHPDDSDAVIREKGKALVGEAFSLLSSNLLAALAAGGPSNAIPFCSVEALPLTKSVAQANAVELRRVSHRVRNPTNVPTPAEARVLREFQEKQAASQSLSPVIDRTADGVVFYAPIVINNGLCLTCHGDPQRDIEPATLALLAQLYPEDQATGFQLHDLRGMWVVTLKGETRSHPDH
jgi:hypothetical protein